MQAADTPVDSPPDWHKAEAVSGDLLLHIASDHLWFAMKHWGSWVLEPASYTSEPNVIFTVLHDCLLFPYIEIVVFLFFDVLILYL